MHLSLYWASFVVLAMSGCAGTHFQAAAHQPLDTVRFNPADVDGQEYWCGIVFNGEKIGFSHFRISKAPDTAGQFDIVSEAVFSLKFLMVEKRFSLKAHDRVNADLTIARFSYDYDMDDSVLAVVGKMEGTVLKTSVDAAGEVVEQDHPVTGPVYPSSVLYLYPSVQGLRTGRIYEYLVYDGETRSISPVRQEILACEESDLFEGTGFKVMTVMHGQEATAWLDASGRPLLETAMGGVMISGLEDEARAKAYLARSSVNKSETLLDFSLIRTEARIEKPRQVEYLEVVLAGLDEGTKPPSDARQRCSRKNGALICRVDAGVSVPEPGGCAAGTMDRYLRSSVAVPAASDRIRGLAAAVAQATDDPQTRIRAILSWIDGHIEKEAADVFSALDVLDKGRAECQGHALLYAALARAAGIPTRVVNGIVYSGEHQGFLYHTWAESCIGGAWTAVDPTFAQEAADATHIKIVEGDSPEDLMPLVGLIGRLRAEIVTYR
ncbi:MAG TPA: transglutaminase-like domain-containing protein [Deltaproteobacteria bacterium]|nr:transglutaminase-like domain-containing protein [Deltaproteobacteria bacterium]